MQVSYHQISSPSKPSYLHNGVLLLALYTGYVH